MIRVSMLALVCCGLMVATAADATAKKRLNFAAEAKLVASVCAEFVLSAKAHTARMAAAGYAAKAKNKSTRYRKYSDGRQSTSMTAEYFINRRDPSKRSCTMTTVFTRPDEARGNVEALIQAFRAKGFSAALPSGFWSRGTVVLSGPGGDYQISSTYTQQGGVLKSSLFQR